MNEASIDIIGNSLEEKGLSHVEIDEYFLQHYGVQGMKWGQRKAANKANVARLQSQGLSKRQAKNTNRAQNRVDAQRMAATGRNGKVSALKQLQNRGVSNTNLSIGTIARHPLSTKKAANLQLQKNQKLKDKIANGEKKASALILKVGGVSIKDLDFSV